MRVALLFALSLLTACGTVRTVPSQSFDQRLVIGYGLYTAVNDTTAAALRAKLLTYAQGLKIQTENEKGKDMLDDARKFHVLELRYQAEGKLADGIMQIRSQRDQLIAVGVTVP